MKLGLKGFFKRGQKGFTLVELMVVMAIMAILSAVVIPAVSGTSEVSKNSQVTNDAGLIGTAVSDFYGDQNGVEVITTETVNILHGVEASRDTSEVESSPTTDDNGIAAQQTSTRWPELGLTDNSTAYGYSTEFPCSSNLTANRVKQVTISVFIRDAEGTKTPSPLSEEQLAEAYNAINWAVLSPSYTVIPESVTSTSDSYNNYLWLLEKTTTGNSSVTNNSRSVAVFKLMSVTTSEDDSLDTLVYERIY